MNIGVIVGGYSPEFKISVKSGVFILNHLKSEKYTSYLVIITKKLWYVKIKDMKISINKSSFSFKLKEKTIKFDALLNTIHGTPGEDGKLQAYWNIIEIPFSGCDFYESALTFNKKHTSCILEKVGIPVGNSLLFRRKDVIDYKKIVKEINTPFIVKPNRSGSSLGVSKVNRDFQFKKALTFAFEQDEEVVLESFLDGIEVSVGVLQYLEDIKILGITEIISNNDFFDYEAKYNQKSKEITPAKISDDLKNKVEKLAIKIYKTLSINGFSRIDFIIVNDTPYFIEINTNPGLSEESIFPKQIKYAKLSFSELLDNEINRIIKK